MRRDLATNIVIGRRFPTYFGGFFFDACEGGDFGGLGGLELVDLALHEAAVGGGAGEGHGLLEVVEGLCVVDAGIEFAEEGKVKRVVGKLELLGLDDGRWFPVSF